MRERDNVHRQSFNRKASILDLFRRTTREVDARLTRNRLAPNVRSRNVRRQSTVKSRDVRATVLLDVDNRSAVRNERLDKLLRRGVRDAVLERETHDFGVRRGGVEEHDRGGTSGGNLLRRGLLFGLLVLRGGNDLNNRGFDGKHFYYICVCL
jgi:hypothetical protein